MSTVIRLSIVGKTHQRSFRVFAQEKRSKRDGKFLEILGSVNPHLESSKQVVLKKDRIAFWQKRGAQLSPTVEYLVKNGKLPARPKKDRAKKEAASAPAPAPAAETPTAIEEQVKPAENTEPKAADKPAEAATEQTPAEQPKEEKKVEEAPTESPSDSSAPSDPSDPSDTSSTEEPKAEDK